MDSGTIANIVESTFIVISINGTLKIYIDHWSTTWKLTFFRIIMSIFNATSICQPLHHKWQDKPPIGPKQHPKHFFSFLYKYKVNKWFEGHEKTQIVTESSIHLSNGPEWSRFINYFYFFLETDLSTIDGTVIIFFFFFLLQFGSWNSRDKSDIIRSMSLVSQTKKEIDRWWPYHIYNW